MNVNYNIRAYYVSRGLDLAKIEKKIRAQKSLRLKKEDIQNL